LRIVDHVERLPSTDDLLGRACAVTVVRVDADLLSTEEHELAHRSDAGPDSDRQRPKQHPGIITTHRVPQQRNQPDEREESNGKEDQRGEFLWPPVALVLEERQRPLEQVVRRSLAGWGCGDIELEQRGDHAGSRPVGWWD
jgi:hypothetical protein